MAVNILDEHIVTVDSRGGVKLPPNFVIPDGTEICYMDHEEPYFNIYPLQMILDLIEELKQKKKGAPSEKYQEITRLIRGLYASIIDTYTLDDKRRILLPKKIISTIDNKKVLLQGINKHISLCGSQESYDELCKRYIPENYGIKKL